MKTSSFEWLAGLCAILTGVFVFLYAIAFVILQNQLLYSLLLMLVGVFSSVALVAVYQHLKETDASFALWALIFGLFGAAGAAVHGGYDLANAINQPSSATAADLASQIDPRGLLTFGFAGIALFVISWLIGQGGKLTVGLSYLGYVSAVLLVVIYIGRLIILNPSNPVILVPVLLNGFLVSPAWYVWLGLTLFHEPVTVAHAAHPRPRPRLR